jgi:hypothetical protein
MIANKGGRIPMESMSPYLGVEGECMDSAWTDQYGVIQETVIISSDEPFETRKQMLKEALLGGSVSVSIAVSETMSFYAGGVFNDETCGYGADANRVHVVQCIGWGNDVELGDYWIIKNSWSNAWGMDGYIYISMENDLCGVLQLATYADIKFPNDKTSPQVYQFKGTFSLPYSNVTEDISVWYDNVTKQEKISYFDDTDYSIWNLGSQTDAPYYNVLTYMEQGA